MGDCYQDETGDQPVSDAVDVALVEEDVVGVGVAPSVPVEVAGVGVWLGAWVTLGADECEGDGDSV